ncbi:MAG: hypothetical protein ACLP5V_16445 [Candidatus Bathyarchaeia archaeon]
MANTFKRYDEHSLASNYVSDMSAHTVISVVHNGAYFYVFYS